MASGASPTWQAWSAIADLTGVGPGTRLLDVGCGDGAFCELAARRGAPVHGLDRAPEAIATASGRVPTGDFRVGLMEQLPWIAGAFDVVTGFNAFQYALDVEAALSEACRVARPGGRVAVCKYGRPAENEFFAFLGSLEPERFGLSRADVTDPVDRAIERLQLDVSARGELPSVMSFAGLDALLAALASAGAGPSRAGVAAAAAPYRQPDGSYRFGNRLRYSVIVPRGRLTPEPQRD